MLRRPATPKRSRAVPPAGGTARPASLADVAALAGVSAGTVSRALSRPDMISEATRARVLDAVERLGYVTNGSARALAMRRTRTIGAIVPRFGTSSFPTMIQALETTLAAHGHTLLLSAPEHREAREPAILRALLERGVDAVALLGAEQSAQTFALLAAHRLPFVLMWALDSADGDCIGFDERAGAAQVVDHLAELGHRSIGFIGGRTAENERARARFRGVVEALARRGMSLCEDALIETDYGFRQGFEAMQRLVQARAPVTAVVCGNDYLAAGALSALDGAGIEVPRELSIASFNDNEFAAYLHPPLTTVRLPIARIGEEAGRYLIARLRGEQAPVPAALPVQLIVRASTGVAPHPRARGS
ncbi:MAG: LacI family DNA-binding transcriptional regulator [Burkholderiaceae bacterium]|nr:LacI family DNA-binding transcriptional regulator [Burkholderiaceae bacterium]